MTFFLVSRSFFRCSSSCCISFLFGRYGAPTIAANLFLVVSPLHRCAIIFTAWISISRDVVHMDAYMLVTRPAHSVRIPTVYYAKSPIGVYTVVHTRTPYHGFALWIQDQSIGKICMYNFSYTLAMWINT